MVSFSVPFGRSFSAWLVVYTQHELPPPDGHTNIVNKWVEGYLRNYVSGQQRTWVVKWLHLGEHCYNTTYHMSIGMSPRL